MHHDAFLGLLKNVFLNLTANIQDISTLAATAAQLSLSDLALLQRSRPASLESRAKKARKVLLVQLLQCSSTIQLERHSKESCRIS
jgi:hypothetical protein